MNRKNLLLAAFVIVLVYCLHREYPFRSITGPIFAAIQLIIDILSYSSFKDDETNEISNQSGGEIFISQLPNLPYDFLIQNEQLEKSQCGNIPSISNLLFDNVYWQTFELSNGGKFYLFNAYLDMRSFNFPTPQIRIITMYDSDEIPETFCQIWFQGHRKPVIIPTHEYKKLWPSQTLNNTLKPYIVSCKIPYKYQEMPITVSLVENSCDTPTNILKVLYSDIKTEKENFAVCVKSFNSLHEDYSIKLVQWLELVHILGAGKVFFYELQVHPNIKQVLDHYVSLGRIHVSPFNLPSRQSNTVKKLKLSNESTIKLKNEVLEYCDCFYRNMYEYKYIITLDINEVILPLQGYSWRELMLKIKPLADEKYEDGADYLSVQSVYILEDIQNPHGVFKDIPKYITILQHLYMSTHFPKYSIGEKYIFDTERIYTINAHQNTCLARICRVFSINKTEALLYHYHPNCTFEYKNICTVFRDNVKFDATIWRYKKQLITRVTKTLKKLGYFKGKNRKMRFWNPFVV